jgi:hypothetical protein
LKMQRPKCPINLIDEALSLYYAFDRSGANLNASYVVALLQLCEPPGRWGRLGLR